MEEYLDSIEQAVTVFPFIMALIAVPYFYYQYKKYGTIELRKSILTFTFILYVTCCYCLIILPIPSYEEVLAMSGPYTDFRFLGFIPDFFNFSGITFNPATWLSAVESVWFYIPFFNFVMLIPFGIYQKRLFKSSLFVCCFLSLLFSLSFELIQLSGLLGIFPHPYRLFQVDDIFLNTLGAVVGWIIAPKVKENNSQDVKTGTPYSPKLKGRVLTLILDLIIMSMIIHLYSLLFGFNVIGGSLLTQYIHYLIVGTLYFIVLAWFLDQKTPAGLFLGYSYRTRNGKKVSFLSFFFRQIIYFGVVLPLPYLALEIFQSNYSRILTIPLGVIILCIPIVIIIQVSLGFPPFYERLSNTYLTDNRKIRNPDQSQRAL